MMNGGHVNGDHNGYQRSHPIPRQFPPTLPLPLSNGTASPGKGSVIKDPSYWQSTAATNQRLLHVLSDLVKAFIDTESEIQSNLEKLGFINGQQEGGDDGHNSTLKVPKDTNGQGSDDVLSSLDDAINGANGGGNNYNHYSSSSPSHQQNGGYHENGFGPALNSQNITKRNKRRMTNNINNNNDDVQVEFADDGPDLITPTFSFSIGSDLSPSEISQLSIDDDVVLGASRRLRNAVDRILNLLKTVASIPGINGLNSIESSGEHEHQRTSNGDNLSGDEVGKLKEEVMNNEKVIKKLEKELKDAKKTNQVLQEEVNKKHSQLSSLKARIDSTNILDATSLKETNDNLRAINEQLVNKNRELCEELMNANLKVEKFAFAINALRREVDDKNYELIKNSGHHSLTSFQSVEAVRDGTSNFDMHGHGHISPLTDKTIKPFERENNLSGEEDDISSDEDDGQRSNGRRRSDGVVVGGHGSGSDDNDQGEHHDHSHSITSSVFNPVDLTKLYQKIVEEKNQEIEILKQQIKLASNMISSAFPDHHQQSPPNKDGHLDVDLIEELVDCHMRRHLDHDYSDGQHPNINCDDVLGAVGGVSSFERREVGQQTSPKHLKSISLSPFRRPLSPCSSITTYRDLEVPTSVPRTVSIGVNTTNSGLVTSEAVVSNRVSIPKELEDIIDDGGDISSWSESQVSNNDSYVDVQKLDTKLGQLYACVEKLIKSNQQLKSELRRERQNVETLTSEKDALRSEIRKVKLEKETLSKDLEKENQKRRSNESLIDTLRTVNDTLEKRIHQMTTEKDEVNRRYQKISSDHETLKNEHLRCEDKIKEVTNDNQTLADHCRTLMAEKETLEKDLSKIRNDSKQDKDGVHGLKSILSEQKLTISNYQDKVKELISKIDQLETESDLKCYYESKVKDLKIRINEFERHDKDQQALINQLKEQIIEIKNDQIDYLNCHPQHVKTSSSVPKDGRLRASIQSSRKSSSSSPSASAGDVVPQGMATHTNNSCQTIKRLKKVEHDLRALIYQKKYLLNLLGGFQLTERATLALIANMNISIDESLSYNSPLNRFRSIVFVTISLTRMKILARKRKGHQFRLQSLPTSGDHRDHHRESIERKDEKETSSKSGHRRSSCNSLTSTPKSVVNKSCRSSEIVHLKDVRSRKSSTASSSSSVSKYNDIVAPIDQNKSLEEFAERLEKLTQQASFVRDQRRRQLLD